MALNRGHSFFVTSAPRWIAQCAEHPKGVVAYLELCEWRNFNVEWRNFNLDSGI
jgi:hypothetical protein